ncbi:MAG: hypothetical protein JXQ90_08300 [Cyclobacteriaceae bacterium]
MLLSILLIFLTPVNDNIETLSFNEVKMNLTDVYYDLEDEMSDAAVTPASKELAAQAVKIMKEIDRRGKLTETSRSILDQFEIKLLGDDVTPLLLKGFQIEVGQYTYAAAKSR